jgi:rhodanese-related sulfurtransferase
MDWSIPLIACGIVVAVYFLKRTGSVSEARAVELLRRGAIVVDVRSAGEFKGARVKGAINIPMGEVKRLAPVQLPDRSRPILVHCLSGGRSAIAKHQLKGLGYQQVENLGSLRRAATIAGWESEPQPRA